MDDARKSQLHDAPVVTRRSAAARFPPVHPLAAIRVFAGDEDGSLGLDEVLLLGEELVVRRNGLSAQPRRREIDQVCELAHRSCSRYTRSPAIYVSSTRPLSRSPSYGVCLCRWSNAPA